MTKNTRESLIKLRLMKAKELAILLYNIPKAYALTSEFCHRIFPFDSNTSSNIKTLERVLSDVELSNIASKLTIEEKNLYQFSKEALEKARDSEKESRYIREEEINEYLKIEAKINQSDFFGLCYPK
ncbi:MAG: hypothetical protein ACOYT4_05035 [Nanoarchaeota archaeon]